MNDYAIYGRLLLMLNKGQRRLQRSKAEDDFDSRSDCEKCLGELVRDGILARVGKDDFIISCDLMTLREQVARRAREEEDETPRDPAEEVTAEALKEDYWQMEELSFPAEEPEESPFRRFFAQRSVPTDPPRRSLSDYIHRHNENHDDDDDDDENDCDDLDEKLEPLEDPDDNGEDEEKTVAEEDVAATPEDEAFEVSLQLRIMGMPDYDPAKEVFRPLGREVYPNGSAVHVRCFQKEPHRWYFSDDGGLWRYFLGLRKDGKPLGLAESHNRVKKFAEMHCFEMSGFAVHTLCRKCHNYSMELAASEFVRLQLEYLERPENKE